MISIHFFFTSTRNKNKQITSVFSSRSTGFFIPCLLTVKNKNLGIKLNGGAFSKHAAQDRLFFFLIIFGFNEKKKRLYRKKKGFWACAASVLPFLQVEEELGRRLQNYITTKHKKKTGFFSLI